MTKNRIKVIHNDVHMERFCKKSGGNCKIHVILTLLDHAIEKIKDILSDFM